MSGVEREGGRARESPLGKSWGQTMQGWNAARASAAASKRMDSREFRSLVIHPSDVGRDEDVIWILAWEAGRFDDRNLDR